MPAVEFPLFNVFLTVCWFALLIVWVYTVIAIVTDIVRSHDLGGWGKAGWFLFVLLLPFLGAFVYLVARGGSMHTRADAAFRRQEDVYDRSVADRVGGADPADQLRTLRQLHDAGALTDAEFESARAKLPP